MALRLLGPAAPVRLGAVARGQARLERLTASERALTWDWGDGSSSPVVPDPDGKPRVDGAHLYRAAGIYRLSLCDDGSAWTHRYQVVLPKSPLIAAGCGWLRATKEAACSGPFCPGAPPSGPPTFGFLLPSADGQGALRYAWGPLLLESCAVAWSLRGGDGWIHFVGEARAGGAARYPFRVDAAEGSVRRWGRALPRMSLRVYPPGADPSSASPLYRASGIVRPGAIRVPPP